MADSVQGFKCQFIDSVPEDFYCKLCTLVARELSFTSCCGESFCNACILAIQQDKKPCPECGEEDFQINGQKKYRRKISSFQVYCLLKEKGCGWSGRLEKLDAHIDPVNGECEYTDVTCPLKCDQKVGKKNLQEHLANKCVKRDFVCPYCSFKAIYEIVANIHWPECSYYPLPCPNRCGVTCERPTMEDHINICPLQEVECQFQHVGCEVKFCREEEEEHMREKSQDHLAMMAASFVKLENRFQVHFLEQEQKMKAQEQKSEKAFLKYEEKMIAQEEKLENVRKEQEKALKEAARAYNERLKAQEDALNEERQKRKKELKETTANYEEKMKTQEQKFIAQQDEKMKKIREDYEKKLRVQEKIIQKQQEEFEKEKQKTGKSFEDMRNATEKNKQAIKEQSQLQDTVKLEIGKYQEEWTKTTGKNVAENTRALEKVQRSCFTHRTFTISNFKVKKVSTTTSKPGTGGEFKYPKCQWKSPVMYTHLYGYKFSIDIQSAGRDETVPWTKASIAICALNGEFDDKLSWPVRAEFTIELINHCENGENKKYTNIIQWSGGQTNYFASLEYSTLGQNNAHFLINDTLQFNVMDIKLLEPLPEEFVVGYKAIFKGPTNC